MEKSHEHTSDKLVSVIIPTYKRPERVKDAIESVLNQTYRNIEIIVVDDNEPNSDYRFKTQETLEIYKNQTQVIYIQHSNNMNGAAARNTGIHKSSGEYICFLDDDDKYLPSKIEKQVRFLDIFQNFEGVYCGRFQNGKHILSQRVGDLTREILTLSFTPTTPSLMFKRSAVTFLNGFDEAFQRHQDFEFLLRFFKYFSLGSIAEPLVEIGVNAGENELHGEELERNKERFLQLFAKEIEELDKLYPGAKNETHLSHYVPVFFDHLNQFDLKRAMKVYRFCLGISFFKTHHYVVKYAFDYMRINLNRKLL